MTELSLYNTCLRKVSLLLREGIWKSGLENPFCDLPSDIIDDLMSEILRFPSPSLGFKASGLKPLLSSGRLRRFEIYGTNVRVELVPALKLLSKFCQNLEDLNLTMYQWMYPHGSSETLNELLRNSPNLRSIHCGIEFDLKALRNCKKLEKIMLHFIPDQPWYDFLEEEHGCFQPLDSLRLFTICHCFIIYSSLLSSPSLVKNNILPLLMHCSSLTSLGFLDTSRALAQLHQSGYLHQVNLRSCSWGTSYDDRLNSYSSKWIRDAVAYHSCMEKLRLYVCSIQSLGYLGSLRNLVLLDIVIKFKDDCTELLCNGFKDIGLRLKHLAFESLSPIDISMLLQYFPNLESLKITSTKFRDFSKPSVNLPKLKRLTCYGIHEKREQQFLLLLSGCNYLSDFFLIFNCDSFDDETFEKFLSRNSLSNLKIAYFMNGGLKLSEHGFRKFFTNAPELEKIEFKPRCVDERLEYERRIREAMLQAKSRALFNKNLVTLNDEYFFKIRDCNFF